MAAASGSDMIPPSSGFAYRLWCDPERAGWQPNYFRQREHEKEQLDEVLRFAESHGCRMPHLLKLLAAAR